MKLILAAIALLQLLATCSGPPPYSRPDPLLPPAYRGEQQSSQLVPPMGALGWWEIFKDPELRQLLRTAVSQNYDVRIAAQRVLQARSELTIVSSNRYPQINALGSAQYTKTNGPPNAFVPREEFLPGILLTLHYEVDLFGRVRSATAAAAASLLSTEFARETVSASVVSSVATIYFKLRELDLELSISQNVLKTRKRSLGIVQERYRAGKGTLHEVAQAQELVAQTAATIPLIQRESSTLEDALSTISGNYPGPIPHGLPLQEQIDMPEIPSAGLPSTLLEQRPDIRAAEETLIASNAQIGVARALLFPQFTVSAGVGFGTAQINGVNYPEGVLSILPQIVQQIFNAGAAKANVTKSQAVKEQIVLEYLQSIHQAASDVSDALIGYDKNRQFAVDQAANNAASAEALHFANLRFINGKVSFLDVLVSQTRSFDTQVALARAVLDERLALVQLYHATGGGWQPEPASPPVPAKTSVPRL